MRAIGYQLLAISLWRVTGCPGLLLSRRLAFLPTTHDLRLLDSSTPRLLDFSTHCLNWRTDDRPCADDRFAHFARAGGCSLSRGARARDTGADAPADDQR